MRVVIASRIFAPEPGAAPFMLAAVAAAYRDAGHEVTVLTTKLPRGITAPELPGITVKRWWVLRDKDQYVRGYIPYLTFDIPLFFRLLFSRPADIYFVEAPPTTGAVARIATWLRRRPYVYDGADLWSDAAQMATNSKFVLWALRVLEKFAYNGARRAYTISDGLVERLRELQINTPTTTVGFGVDPEVFYHQPRPIKPYFIYPGSFSEWHGAEILVRAFAEFQADFPEYALIFVGNGSQREQLSALAHELGVTNFEMRAPVIASELNELLNSATASLSSLAPGQGYDYAFTTKVYSSLAAGCPVIFTGPGPTGPFLEDAPASISVPYEVAPVVAALRQYATAPLGHPEREQLSTWTHTHYSFAAIAHTIAASSTEIARAFRAS